MKLLEILRFEVEYRLRRPATWVFLLTYIALAFMVTTGMLVEEAERAGDLHANGPAGIAGANILISMISLLITAGLFSGAALRDIETRMHPLFATSAITKTDYLGGRFTGALLVNVLLAAAVPLALMLFMQPPFVSPEFIGPFRVAAYVQPYVLLLLPNIFFTGALLFAVAVLTRRSLPVFAVAAFLFFAALLLEEVMAEQFAMGPLAALLEPFGFTALSEMGEFWTPFEKNTRLLVVEGALLWNRLLWFAVGVLILAFTRFRFRIDLHDLRGRQRRKLEVSEEAGAPVRLAASAVTPSFDSGTRLRQLFAVAGEAIRGLVLSRDLLFISLALMTMVVVLGLNLNDNFGVPLWPLTQFIAPMLGGFFPAITIALLTAFYAGELVHRERDAGLADIADANPVPDWALFLGKLVALAGMLVVLQTVLLFSGLLVQVIGGQVQFELGLYVPIVFGLHLSRYLLFAVLAMLIHVLVNNKYFGHLLAVLWYLFTLFSTRFGVEHNMLVYGKDPGWTYSDVSGFGPFLEPVFWFKAYWAGWAILLAVIGNLLWVRGRDRGFARRLRLARRRFNRTALATSIAGALVVASMGGFVYYNTNVLAGYRTSRESAELHAEYERRYGRFADAAQPTVSGTKLHVEIHPEQRVVEVRGTYALVNATREPIRSVHLFLNPAVENRAITLDRPSRMVTDDRERGHRTYELASALQPGQLLQMKFDVRFAPRGFPNSDINTSVVGNGTYFDHVGGRNPNHRRWLPLVGYQRNREIASAPLRSELGLPPRPLSPAIDDSIASHGLAGRETIAFEAVIGTAADQIGIAPGTLRRSWTANGRRYFHYATDVPIKNAFAIFSASYAVHRETYKGVRMEIFYHPTHAYNVQRMARSVRTSLDYYTRNFGPYARDQIRIVEFPRYASLAHAYPGTISYAEAFGWLTRVDEDQHFDLTSAVVAHEVAHQWWGHQVVPASVEGAGVVSEVLAQYSALMVTEKIYGRKMVERFLWNTRIEYLNRRGRPNHPEVPLLFVSAAHANLVYRKGPLAMYALRQYIGEEPLNAALRRFFDRHAAGRPPYATSLHLYAELKAATPPEYHYLLQDFMETITLWNLRTTKVSAEPAGQGLWRVTMDVEAHKLRADGSGKETEVAMNDFIEIGVYAATENASEVGEPLHLQKHRIRSGPQPIVLTVKGEPGKAGIDPDLYLIDRNWTDNIRPVTLARTSAR
jgi:ABC-2 type transport system permease protein